MEVDFTLVVMAMHALREKYEWDPFPTTPDRAANLACIWLDPFWTGLTCQSVQNLVSLSNGTASVFRVTGVIKSIESSTMQKILGASSIETNGNTQRKRKSTICNSVKIHFFHMSHDGNEIRRDFLYSSAFPIDILLYDNHTESQHLFGLFNYNANESECKPLSGMRLFVRPNKPHGIIVSKIPKETVILAIRGPSLEHHNRVLKICNWMTDTIHTHCPDVHTSFCNMRTFCRDMGSTCLFQVFHIYLKKMCCVFFMCASLTCINRIYQSYF